MEARDQQYDYILHLADNSMILGQRLSEWCGHGPVLEQDIAVTNIALDLIGEARSLYQYAAELKGGEATEDSIAFLRDALEYRNVLLVEQPNMDWAYTIARQFFYDAYHFQLHTALTGSKDKRLAEIAAKTVKESTYHLKWSSEWVIRLGDGTDTSHEKINEAVNNLWEYTGEMFMPSETEKIAASEGYGADPRKLQDAWLQRVKSVLEEATLEIPASVFQQKGGRKGIHTEHLGYILADMQFLQRAYPRAQW